MMIIHAAFLSPVFPPVLQENRPDFSFRRFLIKER
jgi:hypothetical protein